LKFYYYHVPFAAVGTNLAVILCSGRSVKEFVDACKQATGVDIKIEYLSRRPGDYAEVFSDPTKINNELNWTAQHTDLKESLSVAWRWQKAHPRGYGAN
jgi:UDP-arabinose 4-epimerase